MIVIGDVHGQYDALMRLVKLLPKNAKLCFVGDLIDRGPKSRQVVEFVKNNGHLCVKGNHEAMMTDPLSTHMWLYNGGHATVKSYADVDKRVFEDHAEWMKSLPLYIKDGNHIVSHSFIADHFNDPNRYPLEDTALWSRAPHTVLPDGLVNVVGHSIVDDVIEDVPAWGAVMVDTGAGANKLLSAYCTETGNVYSVKI